MKLLHCCPLFILWIMLPPFSFAGDINGNFSAEVAIGISGVLGNNEFRFTGNAALPKNDPNDPDGYVHSVRMETETAKAVFDVGLGYVSFANGIGVNLEFQFNLMDLSSAGLVLQDGLRVDRTNSWQSGNVGMFVNATFHPVAIKKKKYIQGINASLGLGYIHQSDISATFTFKGQYIAPSQLPPYFYALGIVDQYSASSAAVKARLGAERIVAQNITIGAAITGVWIAKIRHFSPGVSEVRVGNIQSPVVGGLELFEQQVIVASSGVLLAALEIKMGVYF